MFWMPGAVFSVIFSLSSDTSCWVELEEGGRRWGALNSNIHTWNFVWNFPYFRALSVGKFFIKYLTSLGMPTASCTTRHPFRNVKGLSSMKTADFHRFYQFMVRKEWSEIEQSFESVTHQSGREGEGIIIEWIPLCASPFSSNKNLYRGLDMRADWENEEAETAANLPIK